MAHDDVEIKVIERQTPLSVNSVDYQPFGVKVLKLRIRRNQATRPTLGPVWIHPKGYTPPDIAAGDPARWRVYGVAENDPDLWVAWGAGDERGFCVRTKDRFKIDKVPLPLEDDGFYYVYLHLIHRPPDPFTHSPMPKTLVVQATGEKGQVYGETSVTLTVPEQAAQSVRAHWDWNLDVGTSAITLRGADGEPHIPLYVSRWWPARQVKYVPVDDATRKFLNDLNITYRRQHNSQDRGRVEVTLNDTLLAEFCGDLALPLHDYRLCSAEVMRFLDDYHLVVRLWFYWVHLDFSTDQLLTFVPPDRRDGLRAEAERVRASLKNPLLPWYKRDEIPDVERFDLLLDPNNPAVKYVGTDTHWQEFWAMVKKGEPLQARIASLLDTFRVVNQASSVPHAEPPVFDPLANGLCDIVNQYTGRTCPHRGKGGLIAAPDIEEGSDYVICPRCGSHFIGQGEKALGIAKHAPLLGNVLILQNAVSTSVLEG